MGSGLSSNGDHISINLGQIKNIGEDMLYVNDKVIPIKGFNYILD